jgi:hypothetical protein
MKNIEIADRGTLETTVAPQMSTFMADIPNDTALEPVIQISEVKAP